MHKNPGLTLLVVLALIANCFLSTNAPAVDLALPTPGSMVNLSPAFEPVLMKGLKIQPQNPFLLDFIVDAGNDRQAQSGTQASRAYLAGQSNTLIKYFLASLTIPEKDLWVNLSPYEKNRMIAPNLGATDMGRDMLAQDYILKQLTASLIYPEKNLGRIFWDKVYAKAQAMYGTTDVPVNTFNKVWIVADRADIYEKGNTAYIVGAHLKVMLDEDYMAKEKHQNTQAASISSQVVREVILPQIEEEVNTGKNFSTLRQIYYSMVLASWYKMTLKNAILNLIYADQSKVRVGINQKDPKVNEEIFERYLKAYKKGVFNFIKEDVDPSDNQTVPRKYFSGGELFRPQEAIRIVSTTPSVASSNPAPRVFQVFGGITPAMTVSSSPAMSAKTLAQFFLPRRLHAWLGKSTPQATPPHRKVKIDITRLIAPQIADYLMTNGAVHFNELASMLKLKVQDGRFNNENGKIKIITLNPKKQPVQLRMLKNDFLGLLDRAAQENMPATKEFLGYFIPLFGPEVANRFEAEFIINQNLKSKDPLKRAQALETAEYIKFLTNVPSGYFNTSNIAEGLLVDITPDMDIATARASLIDAGTILRFKKESSRKALALNILNQGLRSSEPEIFETALKQLLLSHPRMTLKNMLNLPNLEINQEALESMFAHPTNEMAALIDERPNKFEDYPELIKNARDKIGVMINDLTLKPAVRSLPGLLPIVFSWRARSNESKRDEGSIEAVKNYTTIQLSHKEPLAAKIELFVSLFKRPDEPAATSSLPSRLMAAIPLLAAVAGHGQTNPAMTRNGGIDLNNSQMTMNVHKDAAMGGVQIKFNAAALETIKRNIGMVFKIESIIPVNDLSLVFS